MQLELERGRDAEVSATAPQRPEQVAVLARTRGHDLTIRRYQVDRQHVVARKAVLAHQPAKAATERQATDARIRNGAAGRREPKDLRFAVQIGPDQTTLCLDGAGTRVDTHAPHR